MVNLAHRASQLETETAFAVLQRAAELTEQGRHIINLGIGQPDFPTPEHIVEAGIKALRDGHHGYTPTSGIPVLREAVSASILERTGADIPPTRIQILPGGKVVIFFAAVLCGEDGGEIIYPDPGFPIYHSAIQFSGAAPCPYPLREEADFAFSADDVLSRITPKTRLVIVNSPANPTGGVTPRAEFKKLVDGLMDHPNVAIMSDEIYDRLTFDGQDITSLLEYPEIHDRLIILNGWSKTYAMTGWRLGYAVWPESMVEAADLLAVNIHSCVNAAAQYAAIEAISGPQQCVDDMRLAFQHRARILEEGLNALPGFTARQPAGAFYAFPNIKETGLSSQELQTALLEDAGVAIVSGTAFGTEGEGFLRFSGANAEAAIEEALSLIKAWLEEKAT
jgi:aspartate/methionine/tyrosine aminotransferase